jgi:uncharacterized protein YjiK
VTARLPLLLTLALAVPPRIGAQEVASPGATPRDDGPLTERFDFEHRAARFELPHRLDEISGLAFSDGGRLFGHGDELGVLYAIDTRSGDVDRGFALGSTSAPVAGDFEGVAVVGDRWFLVSSRGLLYEFREVAEGEASPIRVTDTGVGASCEIEGLAYEAATHSLLLACKRIAPRADEFRIHRLPIDPKAPVPPPLRIPFDRLEPFGLKHGLHPSGIDVDPTTGDLVLVAAEERAIVELSPGGRVLSALELSKDRHPQAEGIAFGPDGRLYLSDEGHGRRARLTVYAPRQETPSGGEDPCPGA